MIQGIRDFFISGSQGRQPGIQQAIQKAAAERRSKQAADLLGRTPEDRGNMVASLLSRTAADRNMLSAGEVPPDSVGRRIDRLLEAEVLAEQLGLSGRPGAELTGAVVTPAMAALNEEARKRAAQTYAAAQGPGIRERIGETRLGIERQLSRPGVGGDLARAGLVTSVIGGGVMGGVALTEAGQQLMALMEHMQQGQRTEAQRDEAPVV